MQGECGETTRREGAQGHAIPAAMAPRPLCKNTAGAAGRAAPGAAIPRRYKYLANCTHRRGLRSVSLSGRLPSRQAR